MGRGPGASANGMRKRFLGQYIVKVCPYDGVEFQTENKQQTYCTPSHQQLDKQRRRRQRIYAERPVEVSSTPGASYRLQIREFTAEAPERREKAPEPVVERYLKLPIRTMSNFQSTFGLNMPELDGGTCEHGRYGDCWECRLAL